ncbi:MAG: hypothetical protein NC337_07170 [Roseburia sp.]|nr:hypothetical protein [Roseburia sp.]
MISIILTVLKIVGIVLLVLLGIVLLLAGLIAFVPIRYRAQGVYQEGKASVTGRITWLLHLISARMAFELGQPLHIRVRVLGIPVFDNLRQPKVKNKKREKSETNTELQTASLPEEDVIPEERIAPEEDVIPEERIIPDKDMAETFEEDAENSTILQKIKIIWKKFVHFIKNIKYTIQRICDTIVKIRENITYYFRLLQEESTKAAFAACKGQLVKIFKNLAPQKYNVHLHLGFEDPATMGEVMAVWGMLYPFHEGRVDILPEFDRAVLEGDFFLKGRISVYVYIRTVLVLFFDKNIRRLYGRLKRNI